MAKNSTKKQGAKKSVLPTFITKIEIKNLKFKLAVFSLALVFCLAAWLIVAGVQSYYKIRYEGPVVTALRALEHGKQQLAMAVLMRAISRGNKTAAMYMAWIEGNRGNFQRSLEYIRKTTEDPEMTGGFEILGDLALLGYGQAIGAGPALYYFNEALKQYPEEERDQAMRLMLERAINLCLTLNDYLRIINEAVKLESPIAKLLRGDIEFLGEEDGKLSPSSANKVWDSADADGVTEAMVRKAGAFWHGYGEPRNYEQAIRLYKAAAKAGNPGAIYSEGLITMRIKQQGAFEQGLGLFRKAAGLGYAPAMTAVAALTLALNPDNPAIIEESFKLFKQAHELGDYTASIYYSLMLYTGLGTEVDVNHALSVLFDLKDHDIKAVDGFVDFLTYVTNESLLPLLAQLLELNYLQYLGQLHFIAGAPEATVYEEKNQELGFFTPPFEDKSISDALKTKLGNNYISKLDDPNEVEINGEPLIVPEFAYALSQSEPSTQAQRFVPPLVTRIEATLPPLPQDFGEYNLDMDRIAKAFDDDFVPATDDEPAPEDPGMIGDPGADEPKSKPAKTKKTEKKAEKPESAPKEAKEPEPEEEQQAAEDQPEIHDLTDEDLTTDGAAPEPGDDLGGEDFDSDLDGGLEGDALGDDLEADLEPMGDL